MPAELLDRFLGVAHLNTLRKIETCGLLLGKQRGASFTISTLLIPEQRGTPDTCIMESEELVVEFSTGRDLLTLGWVSFLLVFAKVLTLSKIHTHPTQSCEYGRFELSYLTMYRLHVFTGSTHACAVPTHIERGDCHRVCADI